MGKTFTKIILVVVVILGVLIAGENMFVKFAVEKGVRMATGLPLEIKKFDIGLLSTAIGIEGLSLYNPQGFPKEVMFYAPEIFVDYKLGAMLTGKIHMEDIRLDFDQFVVVKNKDGQVNLDVLKPKSEKKIETKAEKADLNIQIDHLKVKIGKVVYKDYSGGGEPSVKEFKVNISEEYTDVNNSNIHWLVLAVTQKALMKTTLGSIADLNMDAFTNATDIPKQAIDTLKGTTGSLIDTADSLKDKIKLPFMNE